MKRPMFAIRCKSGAWMHNMRDGLVVFVLYSTREKAQRFIDSLSIAKDRLSIEVVNPARVAKEQAEINRHRKGKHRDAMLKVLDEVAAAASEWLDRRAKKGKKHERR